MMNDEQYTEYEHYTNVEEQEQKHVIRDFIIDNMEDIVTIFFGTVLVVAMVIGLVDLLKWASVSEVKTEYTTATVVGFDEKNLASLYNHYTKYYVYLDINGTEIKTENTKIYMSSEIGDVYNIKLIGEFNDRGDLLSYDVRFIEKLEKTN